MASKASAKGALDKVLFLRDRTTCPRVEPKKLNTGLAIGSREELDEYRCIL